MVGGSFIVQGIINNTETFMLADNCKTTAIQRAKDKIREKHFRDRGNKSSFKIIYYRKIVYQAFVSDYRSRFTIEVK
jgi:hypothetical protein